MGPLPLLQLMPMGIYMELGLSKSRWGRDFRRSLTPGYVLFIVLWGPPWAGILETHLLDPAHLLGSSLPAHHPAACPHQCGPLDLLV